MTKLLLLVAAAVVVYFLVTGYARKKRAGSSAPPSSEAMVPCAHCGVNLPRSEALESSGRFFCSEEHRRAGPG